VPAVLVTTDECAAAAGLSKTKMGVDADADATVTNATTNSGSKRLTPQASYIRASGYTFIDAQAL
jgi:hypothetical protein